MHKSDVERGLAKEEITINQITSRAHKWDNSCAEHGIKYVA